MTDLERARRMLREWGDEADTVIADALAAARREGFEEGRLAKRETLRRTWEAGAEEMRERLLSSLSYPNRSALRESVRENLEQQYANIFGKRCSTDAARRLAECALETAVAFLVRALTPEEPT